MREKRTRNFFANHSGKKALVSLRMFFIRENGGVKSLKTKILNFSLIYQKKQYLCSALFD